MLVLIIGGAYQGKLDFALTLGKYSKNDVSESCFDKPIVNNLHIIIKQMFEKGENVAEVILSSIKEKDKIIICNEIGCGIVPIDKSEREYRELCGRILCEMARNADIVYRVQCGIATKIKGTL